jgi:hypothetical protein
VNGSACETVGGLLLLQARRRELRSGTTLPTPEPQGAVAGPGFGLGLPRGASTAVYQSSCVDGRDADVSSLT